MRRADVPRVAPVDPEIYRRVFEANPDGAAIFEELLRRFARPPVYDGGIDGIRKSDHRAGARSVVEFITSRINEANGVDPNEHESDEP